MDNPPKRLLRIVKSTNPVKKYDAIFLLANGKYKKVSFGASGYDDYTTIEDDNEADKKRNLYILRHKKREETLWNTKPDTPASLSRWILWEYRDREKAIKRFRTKFNLKE